MLEDEGDVGAGIVLLTTGIAFPLSLELDEISPW